MRILARSSIFRGLSVFIAVGGGCVPSAAVTRPAPMAAATPTAIEPTPPPPPEEHVLAQVVRPSAFHVWAERDFDMALEGSGDVPWVRGGVGLAHLVGDRIEHDPTMLKGIAASYAEGGTFLGDFPGNAWLSVNNFVGRDDVEVSLLHWERDRWRTVRGGTHDVREVALWRGGRVLALVGYPRAQLKVFGGAPVSNLQPIDASICASSIAALESGEILVAGPGCDEKKSDEWFAQRWSAAGVRGKPEPLGHFFAEPARIVLRSDREAYIHDLEVGPLLSWDGTTWAPIEVPEDTKVPSLDVSRQGTLWIAGSKLYRRPKGGSWEDVPLPLIGEKGEEPMLVQVWAKEDADVWAVATGAGSRVLRNRAAPAVATLPTADELWRESQDMLPITPATRACTTGGGAVSGFFVSLGTLAKDAALPDLTATRSAIKGDTALEGVRLVETRHQKERQLGAEVDDFDQGVKLTALLKRTLPSLAPRFVCHVFVIARDLSEEDANAGAEAMRVK